MARLTGGPTLLLDGGLGTMLIARGLPTGKPPDAWTLARPEELSAVHRAYVEAGSEAVHANTFGANPIRLARFGLADRCEELNGTAVRLARESGAPFVIADVGPTGEYLPPLGHGDPSLWREAFERQGRALASAGVDALHIETMSDRREALLACECLLRTAPGLPVLVSLTFERKKRGFFTIMGDPLVDTLREMLGHGAVGVGANCSMTSVEMRDLAREARSGIAAPIVIQPNAGQPELFHGLLTYRQLPEEFADDMAPLAAKGIAALGGCCGTDPRFIAALRERLALIRSERKEEPPGGEDVSGDRAGA
jgi:5-methyltetrahydrofolate--homocysteine methyltransferase